MAGYHLLYILWHNNFIFTGMLGPVMWDLTLSEEIWFGEPPIHLIREMFWVGCRVPMIGLFLNNLLEINISEEMWNIRECYWITIFETANKYIIIMTILQLNWSGFRIVILQFKGEEGLVSLISWRQTLNPHWFGWDS